jgi:F-type H+-transporting ATPase subunit b
VLDFSVTFVITIINIVILTVILRVVLFKPVTKFMADRARRIQSSIDQAEKDKSYSQKLLMEYQNKLKNAGAEAEEIVKVARKNAEAEAEEIVRAARKNAEAEARKIIDEGKAIAEALAASARKQTELERQAVFARFKVEAAALVIAASARLVQRDLSGEDNRRYANMLLDELSAKKGNS